MIHLLAEQLREEEEEEEEQDERGTCVSGSPTSREQYLLILLVQLFTSALVLRYCKTHCCCYCTIASSAPPAPGMHRRGCANK